MNRFRRTPVQLLVHDRFQQRFKGGMRWLQPHGKRPGTLHQLREACVRGRQFLTGAGVIITNFAETASHSFQSIHCCVTDEVSRAAG